MGKPYSSVPNMTVGYAEGTLKGQIDEVLFTLFLKIGQVYTA
jgi:hypothetical protein